MLEKTIRLLFKKKQSIIILDKIKYPTKSMAINVHDVLIEIFKDSKDRIDAGILQEANIEFDLWHIKNVVDNEGSFEKRVITKAAHLMNNFITDSHAFVDGNKRTGFVLFLLFLILNKISFDLDLSDYLKHVKFIKKIANRKRTDKRNIPEILTWFKKYNIKD